MKGIPEYHALPIRLLMQLAEPPYACRTLLRYNFGATIAPGYASIRQSSKRVVHSSLLKSTRGKSGNEAAIVMEAKVTDRDIERLHFDAQGLVPAVIQDADTKQVLMLGYMTKQMLAKTLDTGAGVVLEPEPPRAVAQGRHKW